MRLVVAVVRAATSDVWTAAWTLVFPLVPAFILLVLGGIPGLGGTLIHALLFVSVFAVSAHLRGRSSRPAGMDLLARPMPMLPVTERAWMVAVVGVALVALSGWLTVVNLGAWWALSGAPSTNPFAGVGASPGALPPILLTLALAWLPTLVVGARMGNALTPRALGVGSALALGLAFLEVDRELVRAAAWAVVGVPLALRARPVRADRGGRGDTTVFVRPGLRGLLTSMILQTSVAAVFVLPVAFVGLGGTSRAAVAGLVLYCVGGISVVMPLLPGAWVGARVTPLAPELLFRLPVDRLEATLALVGAGMARSVGLVGAALVGCSFFTALPDGAVLFGLLTAACASGAISAAHAVGGQGRVLAIIGLVTGLSLVSFFAFERGSIAAALIAQAAVAAIGAGAVWVSSGRLGWTGRPMG